MIKFITLPLVLLAMALVGCNSENNAVTPSQLDQADAKPAVMQAVDFEQWQQALKDIASTTDIVVVDFWAMWCVSCLEQFPEMVTLSKDYAGKAQFISLNLDASNDTRSLAMANDFLVASGADFAHFHLAENMMVAFEYFDLVGIPAVVFYDRNAQEIFRLTGDDPDNQFTKGQISDFINRYLASQQ